MTYATLMVNLALGQSNAGVLRVAGDLARRFGAAVTGIAACQPMQTLYSDGCYVSPEAIEARRQEIDEELQAAEAEFRTGLEGPRLAWRSAVAFEPPSDYVVREARGADLLLTGMPSRNRADATRVLASELVMQAGRPVLVAPAGAAGFTPGHVMLGWQDTRETRRAAWDALPLLKAAAQVSVVEVAATRDLAQARGRLADVARWLAGHGVTADTLAAASLDDDAPQLAGLAAERGADLIVAGAYGHSRVREWVLGGVTRDLLLHAGCCTLLSH